MNYCINSKCEKRENAENSQFCQCCGTPLLINERYRLLKPLRSLDARTSTEIFEVDDSGTRRVMKILKENNPQLIDMFEREAFTLRLLNHPGIPKVEWDGYFTVSINSLGNQKLHCLVMEKIEGENLEDWLAINGKISEKIALKWLREIIEILDFLHNKRFFHRDIKPSNIMLKPDGKLALIDFGSVRGITNTYLPKIFIENVTSVFSGGYTPPEQINGQAVPQSDFYALGRTFVHLMTGKPPSEFSSSFKDSRIFWKDKAPQISTSLGDFIDRLMALYPADRMQDTRAMQQYLNAKNLFIQNLILLANSRKFRRRFLATLTIILFGIFSYRIAYPLISQQYLKQGIKALKAGREDKAWNYYQKALYYNSKDSRIYNSLGFICQGQNRYSCAISNFEKSLNLDPNNNVTRYNLGELYEDTGDFKNAEKQYQIVIESDSLIAINAISNLGRLLILNSSRTSEAIKRISEGLEKSDKPRVRAALYKNLGWAYFAQNDLKQAKAALEEAIRLDPKRADSYCLLAQVLEAEDKKQQALVKWKKCRDIKRGRTIEIKLWKIMAQQRLKDAGEKNAP